MERGLLWLPLLIAFGWLAWAGWNEYRKVEAYRIWAEDFDKAKYDIYAVLGQKGTDLTWGKPTRQGMLDLHTFSLKDVQAINLLLDDELVDWDASPPKGSPALQFICKGDPNVIKIPFTDLDLALRWGKYLGKLKSELEN